MFIASCRDGGDDEEGCEDGRQFDDRGAEFAISFLQECHWCQENSMAGDIQCGHATQGTRLSIFQPKLIVLWFAQSSKYN